MDWDLFFQVIILMILGALLSNVTVNSVIREIRNGKAQD